MLLDTAVIDELRETLGDDTYRSFANRMLSEVEATANELHRLFAAGDHETLARTAHRTAGSAAGVGAKGLHAILKDIENTARSAAASTALAPLLQAIPPRAAEVRAALTAHLGTL